MEKAVELYFNEMKGRFESLLPQSYSTIKFSDKPSIRGTKCWSIDCNLGYDGISISFWNTGVYEIITSLLIDKSDEFYYRSFVPDDHENQNIPIDSFNNFKEEINELIIQLKKNSTISVSRNIS